MSPQPVGISFEELYLFKYQNLIIKEALELDKSIYIMEFNTQPEFEPDDEVSAVPDVIFQLYKEMVHNIANQDVLQAKQS